MVVRKRHLLILGRRATRGWWVGDATAERIADFSRWNGGKRKRRVLEQRESQGQIIAGRRGHGLAPPSRISVALFGLLTSASAQAGRDHPGQGGVGIWVELLFLEALKAERPDATASLCRMVKFGSRPETRRCLQIPADLDNLSLLAATSGRRLDNYPPAKNTNLECSSTLGESKDKKIGNSEFPRFLSQPNKAHFCCRSIPGRRPRRRRSFPE